ncbi:MAG: phosphoribosylamine--glycine ligase [Kiritimatiellae bacterium]|nr:phosphoribosylamine--glycine ligase [Kiritimatiellia bacterium]
MKVLVVGGGGREHTLAWKLANDSRKPEIFCAPGNAGTAALGTNVAIKAEDVEALAGWARAQRPDLTVVGPEAPLCGGLVDALEADGLRAFGPNKAAAAIEGSKVFSKDVMTAAGVPCAHSAAFTDPAQALAYLRSQPVPIVVKAEGLAAGKGVYVCGTLAEAEQAIREVMVERKLGKAGQRVLVEECLEGEEASILALVDGENLVMLASSQDHKRVFDGDQGPNTGGMGAYSPAPVITDALWPEIENKVFRPTLDQLRARGIVYKGVLYAGLMVTGEGPKVLEFNCRFGDPETQVVLPRIEGDLIPALEACVDGTLNPDQVAWRPDPCVCVVMASGGYPGEYEKGKKIAGLARAGAKPDTIVFHAGTSVADGAVVTAGGRVLGVTAFGADLPQAVSRAYDAVSAISFAGCQYRKDIAARALARGGA